MRLLMLMVLAGMVVTTPILRAARPSVDDSAARVDANLAEQLNKANVKPAPAADDAEFLRRVTLDLAGRIPTVEEVRSFLADKDTARREKAIDRLLASPAYPRHWANIWRRVYLPQADTRALIALAGPFEAWLQQELTANTPHDRLARQILTASVTGAGPAAAASHFLQAGEYRPENLAASSARVFLGLNLDCAQCHNHPFARWKQQQFWDYAAFFATPQGGQGGGKLELAIPNSTKMAVPRLLSGDAIRWPERMERDTGRRVLADWITAKENPYFARNAVNRVWAQLFGIGLVEPIDDLSDANSASHPGLLDDLATRFAASGYDLKALLRTLTRTQAYQRSSAWPKRLARPDPRLFASMPVRGLSGEQLYDSLLIAAGLPLPPSDPEVGLRASPRKQFAQRFYADRPATSQRSVLQALELMNGKQVRDAVAEGKTLAAVAESPFLDTGGRIETLFIAVLGREPTAEETKELSAFIDRRDALERRARLADVFWALVNSAEFSVNH